LARPLYAFGLILLPTLAFVGLVAFDRVLQSGIEDFSYAHRVARYRGYFRYAPELVDYLLSVPPTQRLRIQGLQGGRWQHFRADAVWPFADELWLAWEAKSDEVPNAEISAATVRQANTHLSGAAADLRQQIPPGSRTLIATPRAEIHPSATPLLADNVHRVGVDQVLALAEDTVRAWRAVRARASGLSHDELRQVFTEDFRSRTILASQLLQRLVE